MPSTVFTVSVFMIFSVTFADPYSSAKYDHLVFSDPITQKKSVEELILRVLNESDAKLFVIDIDPKISVDGKDTFQILKNENETQVKITGSTGIAAASGFNLYLKYYCMCQISWNGDQINLPKPLPHIHQVVSANDRFRFYQNVCTSSYSFVWWTWKRWEREIDWMALNGINIALAATAQEAVWNELYLKLGMTKSEVDEHFSGPAFFAWNRMGNIRGWLGHLSPSWHKTSITLQKNIIKRMTDLGIVPVVPAFSGIVPKAFKRLYPKANLQTLSRWNNFEDKYCCPFLLSPEDPLFQYIGKAFLNTYKTFFGIYHVYNSDTFNEMRPSSGELDYIKKIGQEIYQSMSSVDSNAIWMMQGWLFHNDMIFWTSERAEALLTSVPLGKMIVLDLQSELNPQYERLNSYFGQPFIWCMLHNFGGTLGMQGTVNRVNEGTFIARVSTNSSMIGIGLTPEGISTNYVMYDLMLETGWRREPANLSDWFTFYPIRRYGKFELNAIKAWSLLQNSVYSYSSTIPIHGNYIITSHPALNLLKEPWYDSASVFAAWKLMLCAVKQLDGRTLKLETLKYDVVDITRQSLQIIFDLLYIDLIQGYFHQDLWELERTSALMAFLFFDIDKILGTQQEFLLGAWLESAKSFGSTEEEKTLLEKNARNQITFWGPKGEILDYACKQWNGMMSDYYGARWSIFLKELILSIKNKTPFDKDSVSRQIRKQVEEPFTDSSKIYPNVTKGNVMDVSEEIFNRWLPFVQSKMTLSSKNHLLNPKLFC